jgi:hypothetical protein
MKTILSKMLGTLACVVAFSAQSQASTVQFEPNDYTVAEPDGTVLLTVIANRTGDPNQIITVDYATSDGSATAGADYSQDSGTLTFAANETQKQIVVAITNDTFIEGPETFSVILSSPVNATLAAPDSGTGPTATVTIADDDSSTSTVQFKFGSYTVNEGDGIVSVVVERSGGLFNAVDVEYTTFDDTAIDGQDYTGSADIITFLPGEIRQTIDIPIFDDADQEDSESFGVVLGNASGTAIGPQKITTVVINDDDSPNLVGFKPASYTVSEGAGQALLSVAVVRVGDPDVTVTVNYVTRNGSAAASQDYNASSGTIAFGPGETQKQIAIAVIDDSNAESTENFFVDLFDPVNASLQQDGTSSATVTVQDNEGGTSIVRFDVPTYSVNESDGTVALTVKRSGGLGSSVTVNYATSNGSAQAGSDYTSQSGTITFAAGEATKSLTIGILNDSTAEATETFGVTLSTSDAKATIGSPSSAQVSIADDDGPLTPVINSPSSASGTQGQSFSYQITATNNPTSYDASPLPSGLFVNMANGLISGTPSVSGEFDVALTATNANGTGAASNLHLSIAPVGGATPTPTATPTPSGTVSPSPGGTPTPTASPSPTAGSSPTPTPSPSEAGGMLLNVSTRAFVGTGDQALIGGFIVQGNGTKRVLIRAIGPSLTEISPGETLADPTLELHGPSRILMGFNDDWKQSEQQQQIADTGIAPGNTAEAAIFTTLSEGIYTAIVRGSGGTTGIGLVELYDLDSGSSARVVNISTRGEVTTADRVLIGGFILGGDAPTRVLMRALGPSLASKNPPVQSVLVNPSLELRNPQGDLVFSNDDWVDSPQEQEITATTIPPTDSRESAIIALLPAGGYTAIVRAADAQFGVGLVEIYRLSP